MGTITEQLQEEADRGGHALLPTIDFTPIFRTTNLSRGNDVFTHRQLARFAAVSASTCPHSGIHLSVDSVTGNIHRGSVIIQRARHIDKTCFSIMHRSKHVGREDTTRLTV